MPQAIFAQCRQRREAAGDIPYSDSCSARNRWRPPRAAASFPWCARSVVPGIAATLLCIYGIALTYSGNWMPSTLSVQNHYLGCFGGGNLEGILSVDGEFAYIVWKAQTADNDCHIEFDTFVVRDGRIVYRTFAAHITQRGRPAARARARALDGHLRSRRCFG